MKVLLFAMNGSYTHTNLAVRCLRGPLEDAGFEVQILERNLRDRTTHVLQDLVDAQADIVSFSTYIWNIRFMLELARDLKTICPDCRIVLGGPEVSYNTDRFEGNANAFIDVIVRGEGEIALTELCSRIRDGLPIPHIWNSSNGAQASLANTGILYRKDDFPDGSMLYYESSRGCPYACAYCLSSAQKGVRYKDIGEVIDDLKAFESIPNHIKIIKFVDRTFNFNPDRANAIWRALLEERFTKNYHFEICASLLNEESFEILCRFPKGKIQLEVGLQSTYEPTLQAVSRHIDPQIVLNKVKRVHEMGNIHIHLDLIAGLPYEGYERFAQSFDEAYPCCDLLQLGFLKLLHGTSLRIRAEEYGYRYMHEAPYTVLQSNWLSFQELSRLRSIAEILERFRENGKFDQCLATVLNGTRSPFRFFEGLTDFISTHDGRHIQKISQVDAYRLLWEYVTTFLNAEQLFAFSNAMHMDFSSGEVRKVPSFLKRIDYPTEH